MSYVLNSTVSRSEAEALKDMIFKRVRERAEQMENSTQGEVMDLARDSFADKQNPFYQIIEKSKPQENLEVQPVANKTVKTESVNDKKEDKQPDGLGFPPRKAQINVDGQNKMIQEQASSAAIVNTMEEARKSLTNKKSFMGALNFLNSQAAISLARTRSDKFEMIV